MSPPYLLLPRNWCLSPIAALLLLALPARAEIAVLFSENLAPYRTALAAFSAEHAGPATLYQLAGVNPADVFTRLRRTPPRLVLAFGPLAAAAAGRELPDVPVLFTMVPVPERLGATGRMSGVALTVPARAQIEALQAGWPQVSRILLVHDPRHSEAQVQAARRAAQDLGLDALGVPVQSPDRINAALVAAGPAGAVWMASDRTVSSVAGFAALSAYAQKRSVPLLVLSEEQVRQGGTLALAPSYAGLGRQAARMVARVLEGADPRGLPVEVPEEIEVAVAVGDARARGASLTGLAELASRRGWVLRPSP